MNYSIRLCSMKKLLLALMLLCNGILSAYRQDLIFSYLGVKEGLSQGSVFCIIKDHKGFMWFGTVDGLNRYDGLSFTIYNHNVDRPQSLSDNSISCLFEDRDGYLWVGTDEGGLNRMDTGISQFQRYRHKVNDPNSISSDSIRSIGQDREGNLWVGTDQGLDCLVGGSERFVHYQPQPRDDGSIAGRSLSFVLADRDGRIWIGLREMGVDCFHPETGRFVHYRHDQKNGRTLASAMVINACLAPDGMIWICHADEWLSRLTPQTGMVQNYSLGKDANMISGICADAQGNIWVSSANGLYFLNAKSGEVINIRSNPRYPATLITNDLISVYVDETDILWVGTSFFGVNKANLQAKRFINYTRDPTNPNTLGFSFARGIYENRNGVLYIGGEGFDRLDRKSGTWRHFFNEKGNPLARIQSMVYTICPNSDDERDFLWLSTNGDGIFVFDQALQVISPYSIPGVKSRVVYGLYKDSEGFLWIGTDEGLYRYDQKKKQTRYFDLGKIAGFYARSSIVSGVYWMMHDRQGLLWIGSRNYGLFSYDSRTSQWHNFSHDPENQQSLSSNLVTTILATRADELWIGTYGGGVNRCNRKEGTFEHFTTSNGLPNDVVYGILEDGQGQLWISTNLGLCLFNPRAGTFRSYTEKDGLPGNEFNTQSFYKNRWTGELFFGGTNGVTAFYSNEIQDDPHPPLVVLEDFKIFNRSVFPGPHSVLKKPISETDAISLSYRDSMLTFEFNGLHYVAPAKNRFAYLLEGFDRQWNLTDAQRRFATYTNLNPGHYTLRIKAANCDGTWNEKGVTLKIFIAPPFWKTWWFTFLAIVLSSSILFSVYKYRVHGLQKRKTELEKIVALRTQELREMSLRDPLTGLRNRRFIGEVLKSELHSFINTKKFLLSHRHRRDENPETKVFGVFMIDIDRFKAVNDAYGHDIGDRLLVQLSDLLRHSIREDDVVVRMGGEEFLIILKKTDSGYLPNFAKKLKDKIEATAFELDSFSRSYLRKTCSIGFTSFPFYGEKPDFLSFDQVVTLADMGMLHAKESGRNTAVFVKPGQKTPDPEKESFTLSTLDDGTQQGILQIELIK